MTHYPPSQAFMGTSAWSIFVSKLGIAILNDRTYENNKKNPCSLEKGEPITKTGFADFDPKAGILGLSDYLVTQATLLQEKTSTDSPLQAIPHAYWNMETFKRPSNPILSQVAGRPVENSTLNLHDDNNSALINRATPSSPWKGKATKDKRNRRQTQVTHHSRHK